MTETLDEIELAIRADSANLNDLYYLLNKYWKDFGAPKYDLVFAHIQNHSDSEIVALAIRILSSKGVENDEFWQTVLEIATGRDWDVNEEAKLFAIFALEKFPGENQKLLPVLKKALKSSRGSVRDAVAIVSQYKSGIKSKDVTWGNGSGDLIYNLPPIASEWVYKYILE